jgi:hypothetical protein
MTRGGDGNRGAVSNGNMTINRVWKKRVKDTASLERWVVAPLSKTHSMGDEGAHVCADAGGAT